MTTEELQAFLTDLNKIMVKHNICLDGTEGMLTHRESKIPVGYLEGTLGGLLYVVSVDDEVAILAELCGTITER